jgi:hypothetical protein
VSFLAGKAQSTPYENRPLLGSSIGVDDEKKAGTLGGYIQIIRGSEVMIAGLCNHHVVAGMLHFIHSSFFNDLPILKVPRRMELSLVISQAQWYRLQH